MNALRAAPAESDSGGTGMLVETLHRRARRPARPHLRLPLVHGDRAPADGGRRHPDHVPAHLADRECHGRLRDRPVPRRADRARDRDRLCAPRRRSLARGTTRWRGRKRDRGPQCHAARRLRCRLQRHHRCDLVAVAACSADARPSQHRHRRPADRARQRRRRQHPPSRRPRNRRPPARPAPLEPGSEREPRLVCLGADRRPSPLDRGERFDRRPRRARRRRLADPARRPTGRLARPERPSPRRSRAAEGLRHRHRPALTVRSSRPLRQPRRDRDRLDREGRRHSEPPPRPPTGVATAPRSSRSSRPRTQTRRPAEPLSTGFAPQRSPA